ncbi:MAG: carboxypeptidase regulatory-like domain-containing protein, partial [Thermoplasmata archaeon]|nr:carboxypeptidase regulatory-like domain-containing protein [Thermoplasmata archaeon]
MEEIEKGKLITALFMTVLMAFTAFAGVESQGIIGPPSPPSNYHPANVTVEVLYENGTPASGAVVFITRYYDPDTLGKLTNSTGIAILLLGPEWWGPIYISAASSPDMGGYNITSVGPDEKKTVRIILRGVDLSYNTVSGVVTDKRTGAPLNGVNVKISGWTDYSLPFTNSTTTDSTGHYTMTFPNTKFPVEVTFTKSYYQICNIHMYLKEGKRNYMVNATLIPERESPPLKVEVHIYNSTTGVDVTGRASIGGYSSGWDHTYISEPLMYNGTSKKYSVYMFSGEYYIYFGTYRDPKTNVSVYAKKPVIINTTPVNLEMPIPFTKLRNVYVNVSNGTAPIKYARAYYSWETETPSLMSYKLVGDSSTRSVGKAHLGIPPGENVTISVYKYRYVRKHITIPAGDVDDPVYLDVVLERKEEESYPEGNVSIKVVDSVTGIHIPSAYISAWGMNGDRYIDFDGWTEDDGYYNSTVEAGFYEEITVTSSLGTRTIRNVTVGEGRTVELTIELNRWETPIYTSAVIRLVDEEGRPVPRAWLYLSGKVVDEPLNMNLRSDDEGYIYLNLPAGEYWLSPNMYMTYTDEYRPQWSIKRTQISLVPGEDNIFTITAYRTNPLIPITGFIREKESGDPIPYASIYTYSLHDLEETRNGYYLCEEEEPNAAFLYDEEYYSLYDGFYRIWGLDKVVMNVYKDGYFPKEEVLQLSTRVEQHDIFLERIPEFSTYIQGILVDQDMNPISGEIFVIDTDHDDYLVDIIEVGEDGLFNVSIYPGNFVLAFHNDTLDDSVNVQVPEYGLSGLVLKLIPRSIISGTVRLWNSSPAVGVNVTLVDAESGEVVAWNITGEDGVYELAAVRGSYHIVIEGTEIFEGYISDLLQLTGWNKVTLDIVLQKLSHGVIMGAVMGDGGPLNGMGIEGATVSLYNTSGEVESVETNSTGEFTFSRIPFGVYHLSVDPPANLKAVLNIRSGYLSNNSTQFSLEAERITVDVHLPYVEVFHARYLNITGYGPTGDGVPLDEVIWISFSEAVNRSSAEGAITITPNVGNISFGWSSDGRKM